MSELEEGRGRDSLLYMYLYCVYYAAVGGLYFDLFHAFDNFFPCTVQFGGEMSELDDAGTYFDLGPRKVTETGIYYYMCSRNNNFTNRGQKGKIIALLNALIFARIGWNGGSVNLNK